MEENRVGKAIILDGSDNVATAVEDLADGMTFEQVGKGSVQIVEPIPAGHKFALTAIRVGSQVIKYGESIGVTTKDVFPGQWVHVHNVEGRRGRGDLAGR